MYFVVFFLITTIPNSAAPNIRPVTAAWLPPSRAGNEGAFRLNGFVAGFPGPDTDDLLGR